VLFLDEIGDMPMALQPRLLRVLQDRELSPLGGGKPVKLDFALICATHRHLEHAVAEGRFRADLYYRISHHIVALPALRASEARDTLVRTLWERIGQGRRLSGAAQDALVGYDWPGNLRQLVASLRTLVALSEPGSEIGEDALPAYLRTRLPTAMPSRPATAATADLDAITLSSMRAAVEACGGNIARAARQLGVSRSTLYRRLGADPRAS
jgi:transcriptional regulator of acetoin/glycerol metabolism